MGSDTNIVVIGAGSASFGLETLGSIIERQDLQNTTLHLVDINNDSLKTISALAKLMKNKWNSSIKVNSTLDRKQVLNDADFVVLSVAIDREETWLKDYQIAEKYGVYHYAENGLMGSFTHTARGLAYIKPILIDIKDHAPDAWLINFTNPVPRIGYAAEQLGIKTVGLCHQIHHGYGILARYLAEDLGITEDLDFEVAWNDKSRDIMHKFSDHGEKEYDMKAGGLNHFTWMMEVRRRSTNEDMYPLIRSEAKNVHPNFEPLTQKMFDIYGLLPVPGDCHLTEYVPYTLSKENWEKYRIQLYNFERGKQQRDEMWRRITDILTDSRSFDIKPTHQERGDSVISAITNNLNSYEQAVNIPNNGAISNLPDDSIVEIPALVNNYGISGMKMGKLPEAVAALCMREISIAKLITNASMTGDRHLALQAFALMLDDLDLAEKLLEIYINKNKNYLPQFYNNQ
jgi:alpha-galactosidase